MDENKGTGTRACFRWITEALVLSFFLWMPTFGFCGEGTIFSGLLKEFRLGVAAHDVDGLWSGSSMEEGPDLCAEIVFNRQLFQIFSIPAFPNTGLSINTRGDTSKIYGGFMLQWEPSDRVTLSTGLGLALHNGELDTEESDKKSLGSRVLFRIPIEIGLAVSHHHRFILAFDHISNANLTSPNDGLDTLGFLYAYEF